MCWTDLKSDFTSPIWRGIRHSHVGCLKRLSAASVLEYRSPATSAIGLITYGNSTRSFNSSNQYRTTLI